jgi:hypothetical protein
LSAAPATGPGDYVHLMDRRPLVAGVATVLAIGLLLFAASSGPTRLWSDPPPAGVATVFANQSATTSSIAPEDTIAVGEPVNRPWSGNVVAYLAVLVTLLVVVLVVRTRGVTVGRPRWRSRLRMANAGDHLPEIEQPDLMVDVVAADEALGVGSPKNAIVACWMHLERGVAASGLERLPAETSLEYVARVVATSSVRPEPIGELADLYREARFSRHDMSEADRMRARALLSDVVAAVRHGSVESV